MTDTRHRLEDILKEHRLRRRSFLKKTMLAPAAYAGTGLLVNLMAAGRAWAQETSPITTTLFTTSTTLFTTIPITTTLFTTPTTLFTTIPITTTLFTTLPTFPTTIFPPFTTGPINRVPEPPTVALAGAGIAAAIAMSKRLRALAARVQVAPGTTDADHQDQNARGSSAR